jgi:deoxyhypusine synthase
LDHQHGREISITTRTIAIGLSMHHGSRRQTSTVLRDEGVVRIMTFFFDYTVLLKTDAFYRVRDRQSGEFQKPLSTAECHHLMGNLRRAREHALGLSRALLAGARRMICGVPIYTSSPGTARVGMTSPRLAWSTTKLAFDVSLRCERKRRIVYVCEVEARAAAASDLRRRLAQEFSAAEPSRKIPGKSLGFQLRAVNDFSCSSPDARTDTGGLFGRDTGGSR